VPLLAHRCCSRSSSLSTNPRFYAKPQRRIQKLICFHFLSVLQQPFFFPSSLLTPRARTKARLNAVSASSFDIYSRRCKSEAINSNKLSLPKLSSLLTRSHNEASLSHLRSTSSCAVCRSSSSELSFFSLLSSCQSKASSHRRSQLWSKLRPRSPPPRLPLRPPLQVLQEKGRSSRLALIRASERQSHPRPHLHHRVMESS
jgi:hypothetical protein